jgi:hypothetical protein
VERLLVRQEFGVTSPAAKRLKVPEKSYGFLADTSWVTSQ